MSSTSSDAVRQAIALHLDDVPGVRFGYTETPWRLWLAKDHVHYQERRPLSPEFTARGDLVRFVADHAPHLQQQAAAAAAAGFDHGAGTLLPNPPLGTTAAPDLTRVGWQDRHELLRRIQDAARRPPVQIAVDLRQLELLGEDGIVGDLMTELDDTWELKLGPLRALMTLDQVSEVLHAFLEMYVDRFAPILMTIVDRLPYGAYTNPSHALGDEQTCEEWERVVGALWLAVDSYRDLWPLRRGGYDDAVWELDSPPPGVEVQRPLAEDEYYRPPRWGADPDDLRANLRRLLRRTPRAARPGADPTSPEVPS